MFVMDKIKFRCFPCTLLFNVLHGICLCFLRIPSGVLFYCLIYVIVFFSLDESYFVSSSYFQVWKFTSLSKSLQAARETGALKEAKDKLEKNVEELTWRLQLEKRLRVILSSAYQQN